MFEKIRFSTSYEHKRLGLKQKIRGLQGEKSAKRCNETTAVMQKSTKKSRDIACKEKFVPPYLRQVAKGYVATSHNVV